MYRSCNKDMIDANTMLKLVYHRHFFDVEHMKNGARSVITITRNEIVGKVYTPGSRRAQLVRRVCCSPAAYKALCGQLADCIQSADRQDFYDDDSSEELRILHQYGREQIIDRGLGNKNVHIGSIMHRFLTPYLGEDFFSLSVFSSKTDT